MNYSSYLRYRYRDHRLEDQKGTYNTIEEVDNAKKPWSDFDSKIDQWTGKDEHYWFRTTITVPDSFDEKPYTLYLRLK